MITPSPDQPLAGAPLAVLDFETTGLSTAKGARACEVSVMHVILGKVGQFEPTVGFESVINPGIPIPEVCTKIHGITDEMAAQAPPFVEIASELMQAIEGRILVVQNLPFDYGFLAAELALLGFSPPTFCGIDTLVIAKAIRPPGVGNSLGEICKTYDIEIDAHRASGDTLATALALPHLLHDFCRHSRGGVEPVRSFAAFWAWQVSQKPRGWKKWLDAPPTLI